MGANENGLGEEGVEGKKKKKNQFPEYFPGHPEVIIGRVVAMAVARRVPGRREDGGD
jgi:hypothetical protein